MHFDDAHPKRGISRRSVLKVGAAGALAAQAGLIETLAWMPNRLAMAAGSLPNIQFDIGNFIPKAFNVEGTPVRFGPVFTLFVPAKLSRNPSHADQATLAGALNTLESHFAFNVTGLFTFVSYGIPYFNRLPGGLHGGLVSSHMPKLLLDTNRYALEEARATTTDIVAGNGIVKDRFNVPVVIEGNDMLFTFRSDSLGNIGEALAWLEGSGDLAGREVRSPDFDGLLHFQTPRLMFQQPGLPRKVAERAGLKQAPRINPLSPMWFGFYDQQTDSSAGAQRVTFEGDSVAKFTNAKAGDYFVNGSIQTLSHDILDITQFYLRKGEEAAHPDGEPYNERLQYMFRSNQLGTTTGLPADAHDNDPFELQGFGQSAVVNKFQGADDTFHAARDSAGKFSATNVSRDATFTGLGRIGHEQALQRSSRASDGTPVHIRMDGTGFDSLDVPDGTNQPKLQFTAFIPTSEFFRAMRDNAAAQDLAAQFKVQDDDNGLERFMTATRRQNFLVPPRTRRAFPLLEMTRR
jgi:hypothetical protein